VPHLLLLETSIFKVISERPVILTYECRALGEGAITTYFKRLRLISGIPRNFAQQCLVNRPKLDKQFAWSLAVFPKRSSCSDSRRRTNVLLIL
jgi:hypothetical protein